MMTTRILTQSSVQTAAKIAAPGGCARSAAPVFLALIILLLFSGCAVEVTPEVDTDGDATVYHYWNNYDYLNGSKAFAVEASAGESLHVVFESVVKEGSVEVKVVSPKNKTLWKTSAAESGVRETDIAVDADGEYSVIILAKAASGRYDIKVRTP